MERTDGARSEEVRYVGSEGISQKMVNKEVRKVSVRGRTRCYGPAVWFNLARQRPHGRLKILVEFCPLKIFTC